MEANVFIAQPNPVCRNPSFGLVTKTKGLQGCGPRRSLGIKGKRSQGCRLRGSPGVTSHTPGNVRRCEGVWGSMREWTFTLPRQFPFWEMESWWTFETSESDFRGQNSMACGIFYIIEKVLELRCLKWAHIAHLDIWNTSYDPKKGWELNYQFDSRLEKVRNRLDLLNCRGRATYCWKAFNESYNFALDRISIWGLFAKLCGSKVVGVPTSAISGLPLGSPGRENPFGCRLCGQPQNMLWGGRWWLPPSPGCGESSVFVLPMAHPSTKGAPTMH